MNRNWIHTIVLTLALMMALTAVSSTYRVFNQTVDEAWHIAAGLEWLGQGKYTFEYQHPPLARIAVAIWPYLAGMRVAPGFDMWKDSFDLLYQRDYWDTLSQARAGTLLFLIQGVVFIYLFGRRWFGPTTGLAAGLLFLALPPVLGHAGLATLDMACASSLMMGLYAVLRWREEQTTRWLVLTSLAITFAVLCKFSNLLFLGLTLIVSGFYLTEPLRASGNGYPGRRMLWARQAALFLGVSFVFTLAVYRFHFGTLNDHIVNARPEFAAAWEQRMQSMPPERKRVVETVVHIPLPLLEVAHGFREIAEHNRRGHQNFLLGEFSMKGHWYFFPVVIAVKTPPAFLVLLGLGLWLILSRWKTANWPNRIVVLSPAAALLACALSDINIGIRHCLAVFPFFALIAAHALIEWGEGKSWQLPARLLRGGLAAGVLASCFLAYPDFLAYFNFAAGDKPEKIVVDSDLDWGQDLARLSTRLAEKKIDFLHLAYFGSARPAKHGLPRFEAADPLRPTTGWVAISAELLYMIHAKDGSYDWLWKHQPKERIGKSIFLYYIEPAPNGD